MIENIKSICLITVDVLTSLTALIALVKAVRNDMTSRDRRKDKQKVKAEIKKITAQISNNNGINV